MRQRQTLLVAVAVVVAVFLVVQTLQSRIPLMEDELFQKQKRLQRYESILAEGDVIGKALRAATDKLEDLKKGLLKGGGVQLQELVRSGLDSAGLKTISLRPLEPVDTETLIVYPLQLTFTGDLKAVVEFLNSLCTERYLIEIEYLKIRQMNVKEPGQLRVEMEIRGFSMREVNS